MRKFLKWLFLPAIKLACRLAFNQKYLRGRHFTESNRGWGWAWRGIWWQKILGYNRNVPWPCSPSVKIMHPEAIEFDPDDLNNFQTFGCYYSNSAKGRIVIGKGTYIAPNVGIITTNHNPMNPDELDAPKEIILGRGCWVGMNAVILPGVVLGDHTVVGAGSVVSSSFKRGYGVLVGVPARVSLTYPRPGDPASESNAAPGDLIASDTTLDS